MCLRGEASDKIADLIGRGFAIPRFTMKNARTSSLWICAATALLVGPIGCAVVQEPDLPPPDEPVTVIENVQVQSGTIAATFSSTEGTNLCRMIVEPSFQTPKMEGAFAPCTSPFVGAVDGDGLYTIEVENSVNGIVAHSIVVDDAAPIFLTKGSGDANGKGFYEFSVVDAQFYAEAGQTAPAKNFKLSYHFEDSLGNKTVERPLGFNGGSGFERHGRIDMTPSEAPGCQSTAYFYWPVITAVDHTGKLTEHSAVRIWSCD